MKVQVQRAYKFRLYPSAAQMAELSEWERQLRWLYNLAHEQRLLASARHLRPKSPGVAECRSCGAPTIDATAHAPDCARAGYAKGACRGCGVKQVRTTDHTAYCAWVDYFSQGRQMTEVVRVNDRLARVVCSARQEILRDLDKAWQRWRKKLGGKPRFKRRTDAARIYLSTPKHWKVSGDGALILSGAASSVGPIRIRQDRPWPGDAKFTACHIVRDVDEWYAVFPLEFSVEQVRPKGGAVGINRGAVHAVADSRGRIVDSPRFYAAALGTIRARARDLDRKVPFGKVPQPAPAKYRGLDPAAVDALAANLATTPGRVVYEVRKLGGLEAAAEFLRANAPPPPRAALAIPSEGRNRERARVHLAHAHQTVRRQRECFLHEQSRHFTDTYSTIGIEDWSTKAMTESEPREGELRRVTRARNRMILDVGWYELGRQIQYKAEATGSRVVLVDPGLQPTASHVTVDMLAELDTGAVLPYLSGEAGISGTCSSCGAVLLEPASGRKEAWCGACHLVAVGDVNAATNVLKRALFPIEQPPPDKSPKVTIKIKGRVRKARTVTAGKSPGEAYGGEVPVGAPDEVGTRDREGPHHARTVEPRGKGIADNLSMKPQDDGIG